MDAIRVHRVWSVCLGLCAMQLAAPDGALAGEIHASGMTRMDDAKFQDWLARWSKNITNDARNRYCDRELGEEIGWLISPFLDS